MARFAIETEAAGLISEQRARGISVNFRSSFRTQRLL
jgi:hypothetical protein